MGEWSSFHARLLLRGIAPFALIVLAAALKVARPYAIRLTAPTIRRAARVSRPYLERASSSESPKLKKFGQSMLTVHQRASQLGQRPADETKLTRGRAAARLTVVAELMPLVLLILFSFCATVSKAVFSSWDCVEFKVSHERDVEPRLFLRLDMSIECDNGDERYDSQEYRRIEQTAYILLAIWPVILPILFPVALIPIRNDLRQKRNTPLVRATAFLHKEYEAQYFFWEPLNIVQRLIMVGFVQLVRAEWLRLQIGLALAIIYTLALLYCKPYKRDDVDILAIGAQICLLGIFLGCLNIKLYAELAAMGVDDGSNSTATASALAVDVTGFESQRQAEIAMLLFNLLAVALFIASTVYISLTSKAPRTVRLLHNSLPPELGLQPGHNFHLFLSHTWSSGQDQVATIKRQLQ